MFNHNIPFILSTVSTSSIETISEITEGKFWFQLYHPAEESVTKDLLKRAQLSGCKVLIILADVPSFGYRPRDIRNGLAMPPKLSIKNVIQFAWLKSKSNNSSIKIENIMIGIRRELTKDGKSFEKKFSGWIRDLETQAELKKSIFQ